MKKFRTQFIFSALLALVVVMIPQTAKAEVIPSSPIQELANKLTSPELIAKYIFRNFSVESDQANFGKEDLWQAPEQLVNNKKGDCEDFAIFANEMLKENGVSSFMVAIYGDKFAHTVCVFKENGKYSIIDGDEVKRYDASTLEELFTKVYPYWNKAQMVGFSSSKNCGKVLKTFTRS